MSTQSTSATTKACPFCNTANTADSRFCSGCGSELRDQCPQCRFEISVADGFCGGCGFNVKEHYEKQVNQIQTGLVAVQELVSEYRFDEAIAKLAVLSKLEHPRLQQAAKDVKQIALETRELRDKKVADIVAQCDQAQQYADTGLVDSAVQQLQDIPKHLIPSNAKKLLDDLQYRRSTVDSLKASIEAQIQEKRVVGLLPKLAKFRSLTDSDEFQALADKLVRKLKEDLGKAIEQGQFAAALKLTENFVPPYRTPDIEKTIQSIRGRLALSHMVKNQSLIDSSLLRLVQRLQKESPENSAIANQIQQVQKALGSATKEDRVQRRVRAAKTSAVPGLQTWLTHRITSCSFSSPDLAKLGSQFVPAIGAALQQVVDVPVDQNFRDSKNASLLNVFKSRKSKAAWGVVLDGNTLQAARVLAGPGTKEPPVVNQLLTFHLEQDQQRNEDSRSQHQQLLAMFQGKTKDLPGDLVLTLSPKSVLPRFFSIPKVDNRKTATVIDLEMQHQCPFSKDEVVTRHHLFGDDHLGDTSTQVMGTIVRKSDLVEYSNLCSAISLNPTIIQTKPQAIYNLLSREWFQGAAHKFVENDQGLANLDIGNRSTVFLLAHRNRFWWRYFPLGKQHLINQVSLRCRLTNEQAAKLVANPAAAPSYDLLLDAFSEFYDKFLSEVLGSQNQSEQFMRGISFSHLTCSGYPLPYLLDVLRHGNEFLTPWSKMAGENSAFAEA